MIVAIILMAQISPSVTVMALIPLLVVGIVANIATRRIEHYRRASRQAAGDVSGFIGEFFGAVQAVKVATAEKNVISHFHTLNEERRKLTVREKLFDDILSSIYRNTSTLGHGCDLDPGRAIHAGGQFYARRFLAVRVSPAKHGRPDYLCRDAGRALQTTGCLCPAHVSVDGKRAPGCADPAQPCGFERSTPGSNLSAEERIRPLE